MIEFKNMSIEILLYVLADNKSQQKALKAAEHKIFEEIEARGKFIKQQYEAGNINPVREETNE